MRRNIGGGNGLSVLFLDEDVVLRLIRSDSEDGGCANASIKVMLGSDVDQVTFVGDLLDLDRVLANENHVVSGRHSDPGVKD